MHGEEHPGTEQTASSAGRALGGEGPVAERLLARPLGEDEGEREGDDSEGP